MDAKQVNPNIALICGTVLVAIVMGGLFALVWHGSVAGAVVVGVIGTVLGIAGGLFGGNMLVAASANAEVKRQTALRASDDAAK